MQGISDPTSIENWSLPMEDVVSHWQSHWLLRLPVLYQRCHWSPVWCVETAWQTCLGFASIAYALRQFDHARLCQSLQILAQRTKQSLLAKRIIGGTGGPSAVLLPDRRLVAHPRLLTLAHF